MMIHNKVVALYVKQVLSVIIEDEDLNINTNNNKGEPEVLDYVVGGHRLRARSQSKSRKRVKSDDDDDDDDVADSGPKKKKRKVCSYDEDQMLYDIDDENAEDYVPPNTPEVIDESFFPINYTAEEARQAVRIKRAEILCDGTTGASAIKTKDTFDKIGGLDKIVEKIREAFNMPVVAPGYFSRLGLRTVHGMILHGPPGVGKTMMARALCDSVSSTTGSKVAFFLRKGSDILNSYVGQSEANMRKLFDLANLFSPSIIFFDEVDAIAPHRTTNENNHVETNVVSTLLALMDGLDDRGKVFVIGATNRLEAIDPALRRPGRFGTEFYFPLPDFQARKEIIMKMTKDWPRMSAGVIESTALATYNYSGADLSSLCDNAAKIALKRHFPNINFGSERVKVDDKNVQVKAEDFKVALANVSPTSNRTAAGDVYVEPLKDDIKTLLSPILSDVMTQINNVSPLGNLRKEFPCKNHPVVICCVRPTMSKQLNEVGRAILHHYDGIRVFTITATDLLAQDNQIRALQQKFEAARSSRPSVLYLPFVENLLPNGHLDVSLALISEINKVEDDGRIMIIATSLHDTESVGLDPMKELLFQMIAMRLPSNEEIQQFFEDGVQKATQESRGLHWTRSQLTTLGNEAVMKANSDNLSRLMSVQMSITSAIFDFDKRSLSAQQLRTVIHDIRV